MQRQKQLISPYFQILHQIILNKYGCNVKGGNGQDQTQLALKEGGSCYSKTCFVLLSLILGLDVVRWY